MSCHSTYAEGPVLAESTPDPVLAQLPTIEQLAGFESADTACQTPVLDAVVEETPVDLTTIDPRSPEFAELSTEDQYAVFQRMVEERDGEWATGENELNLIGIRGMGPDGEVLEDNSGDGYNDVIYAVRMVEGEDGLVPEIQAFPATTDYGQPNPDRQDPDGRLMVPGSYQLTANPFAEPDAAFGTDSFFALNQNREEIPWVLDEDEDRRVDPLERFGMDYYGFAIHGGGDQGAPIGASSWGCQVIPTTGPDGATPYADFFGLLQEDPRFAEGGEFGYTLMDTQEFGGVGPDPIWSIDPLLHDNIRDQAGDPLMEELLGSDSFMEVLAGATIDPSDPDSVFRDYGGYRSPEEAVARATNALGDDRGAPDTCLAFVSSAYAYGNDVLNPPAFFGTAPSADEVWEYNLAQSQDGADGLALGDAVQREDSAEWNLPAGAPVFFDDGEEGSPGHVAIATGEFTEDGEPILITTYYGEEREGSEYPVTLATLSEIEGAVEGRTISGYVQMGQEEGDPSTIVPISYEQPVDPSEDLAGPGPYLGGGPR